METNNMNGVNVGKETRTNGATGCRFWMVARKYLTENRKMLGFGVLAYLAFWVMIGAWMGWLHWGGSATQAFFYTFVASLAFTVIASLMFKDMNGKQKRIATLMTPASAADKFWIRFIVTVPLFMILIAAGYCVLEWSRMLLFLIDTGHSTSFYVPFGGIGTLFSNHENTLGTLLLIASGFFSLSIYMVGSICWPKYSFLKTMALEFGLQMLVVMLLSMFGSLYEYSFGFIMTKEELFAILWTITGILSALTVAACWFTYYKFKTKTI